MSLSFTNEYKVLPRKRLKPTFCFICIGVGLYWRSASFGTRVTAIKGVTNKMNYQLTFLEGIRIIVYWKLKLVRLKFGQRYVCILSLKTRNVSHLMIFNFYLKWQAGGLQEDWISHIIVTLCLNHPLPLSVRWKGKLSWLFPLLRCLTMQKYGWWVCL